MKLSNINFFIKNNYIYFKSIYNAFIKIPNDIDLKNNKNELLLISKSGKIQNVNSFVKQINNLLLGINILWKIEILISGIGYKIKIEKNNAIFYLGYSIPVIIKIPNYIKIENFKNKIFLFSVYKNKIGIFANKILKLKKYDPYKKKGLFFESNFFLKKSSKKKQ